MDLKGLYNKKEFRYALLGCTGLFLLVSIILAACIIPIARNSINSYSGGNTLSTIPGALILFILLGIVANVLLIWSFDDRETRLAKLVWFAYPALQFIFLFIAFFCMERYSVYGYTSSSPTEASVTLTAIALVFAAFGVSSFLTLLGRKKVWKVSGVLLIGAGLLILLLIFNLLGIDFSPITILLGTYVSAILLFAVLYLWVYICNQFKTAAADKGYEGRRFFWIPFFLGIIGILLIIALPNRKLTDIMERLAGPEPQPVQEDPQPYAQAPQYQQYQGYQQYQDYQQ